MPDEHTTPAEIDPAPSPGEPAGEVANQGDESIGASAPQPAKTKSPLITAVEIENFKGIGRPVRIDLRPVTLLFGRNSAGKSTVLHALCYAHEILSHRNVDAHKTELGGDQVDLGGFRNFVHAHDPTRKVRLRFELNLDGRAVPRPLHERLLSEYFDDYHMEFDIDSTVGSLAQEATSGWVELEAELKGEQPVLASYEVGVNEARVGRVHAQHQAGLALEFNPAHPLLESALRPPPRLPRRPASLDPPDILLDENGMVVAQKSDTHADQVREAAGAMTDSGQISRMPVLGLASPLPHWGELLYFDDRKLPLSVAREELQTRVSALLVGIGHVLRDELAQLRYLGPLRDLHPRDDGERERPNPRRWANGSAAWDFLTNDAHSDSKVLKDTSDWLSRKERLDTGYKLRAPSVVELPGDDPLVTKILVLKKLERLGVNPRDYGQETPESPGDIVRAADPQQVVALADRIADARIRKDVQIVTAETDLPVRTSDIGVGISQILPVVVAALDPNRPGITAIEQPELHVHPKIQVELGDLFAQRIDQGGVFLIETHSEHLMLRLLRRIEETHGEELPEGKPPLKPDEISVVFMEQVGSEVRATRLRIDETGEFKDRWPLGFFEERDDELF